MREQRRWRRIPEESEADQNGRKHPGKAGISIEPKKKITATGLRKLPAAERSRVLRASARKAAPDYEPGGSLHIEGAEDIIEY